MSDLDHAGVPAGVARHVADVPPEAVEVLAQDVLNAADLPAPRRVLPRPADRRDGLDVVRDSERLQLGAVRSELGRVAGPVDDEEAVDRRPALGSGAEHGEERGHAGHGAGHDVPRSLRVEEEPAGGPAAHPDAVAGAERPEHWRERPARDVLDDELDQRLVRRAHDRVRPLDDAARPWRSQRDVLARQERDRLGRAEPEDREVVGHVEAALNGGGEVATGWGGVHAAT